MAFVVPNVIAGVAAWFRYARQIAVLLWRRGCGDRVEQNERKTRIATRNISKERKRWTATEDGVVYESFEGGRDTHRIVYRLDVEAGD